MKFQRTYQDSPKVVAWVVRANDWQAERLPSDSCQVHKAVYCVNHCLGIHC